MPEVLPAPRRTPRRWSTVAAAGIAAALGLCGCGPSGGHAANTPTVSPSGSGATSTQAIERANRAVQAAELSVSLAEARVAADFSWVTDAIAPGTSIDGSAAKIFLFPSQRRLIAAAAGAAHHDLITARDDARAVPRNCPGVLAAKAALAAQVAAAERAYRSYGVLARAAAADLHRATADRAALAAQFAAYQKVVAANPAATQTNITGVVSRGYTSAEQANLSAALSHADALAAGALATARLAAQRAAAIAPSC